jgi:hypothetical protein
MRVTLRRIAFKDKYTIGKVYINDRYFSDSIEDKDRNLYDWQSEEYILEEKVKHETAIPYGIYKLMWSYSPKYKRLMPEIVGVKGFSGIRIHSGNTADDSSGCILLGFNKKVGKVVDSRKTCKKFDEIVEGYYKKGEPMTFEITK